MRQPFVILALLIGSGCTGDIVDVQSAPITSADEQLNAALALQESEDNMEAILPNLGTAPELQNEVWLNSETPLRLADLRGQVVLLEMWTFG